MSGHLSDAECRVPSSIDPPIDHWPAPHHGRRLSFVAIAFLVVAAVGASLSAGASSNDDAPQWRDATRAERQLDDAERRLQGLRDGLDDVDRRSAEARTLQAAAGETTVQLADDLRRTRAQARSMAVESYMTGGGLTGAVFLLDASTANDLAFRATLLNEGADAVADTTADYLAMREDSTAETVALSLELDELDRERNQTVRRLERAERDVADAQRVLAVALVHREADTELAQTRRVEPSPQQWAQVRECESLDDYEINTGNGFYGAYQFELQTWIGVGGSGLPNHASPEEQDARARLLYGMHGAQPWPLCGRYLPGS